MFENIKDKGIHNEEDISRELKLRYNINVQMETLREVLSELEMKDKMERGSYLYSKLHDGKVTCLSCLRRCVVPEGNKGWCTNKDKQRRKII